MKRRITIDHKWLKSRGACYEERRRFNHVFHGQVSFSTELGLRRHLVRALRSGFPPTWNGLTWISEYLVGFHPRWHHNEAISDYLEHYDANNCEHWGSPLFERHFSPVARVFSEFIWQKLIEQGRMDG